jgi:hypothetical protein
LCGEEPADMQPTFSDPRISGIVKRTPESTLLITVNRTLEDVGRVVISCPGFGARQAEVVFEKRTADFAADSLSDNFTPGQRHLYRIK